MADVERKRKFIINIAFYGIILFLAHMLYKYAFGVAFPIVFAFAVATILQRPRNFIVRNSFIKKGLASAICVILFFGIIAAIFVLIGMKIFEGIRDFVAAIISRFENIDSLVATVEDFLFSFAGRLPKFLSEPATEGLTDLFIQVRGAIEGTSTELTDNLASGIGENFDVSWVTAPLAGVISTVAQIPNFIISVVIAIVATCFMTADYDYIVNFIKLQFPESKRKDLSRAKRLVFNSLGKMARAYALIMLITFIEMYAGLTVLSLTGIFTTKHTVIIAAIVSVVDIAPMLGTGTILLPWAVYSFIAGKYSLAIGLFIIYAVITVIRQIIEPKLVAGQLGLSPVITISAMFLGLKLLGFLGLFLAPLMIIILKLLHDEGILHLWKSPVRAAAIKAEEEKAKAEKDPPAEDKSSSKK